MSIKLADALVYLGVAASSKQDLKRDLDQTERDARGWASRVGGSIQGSLSTAIKIGSAAVVGGMAAIGAGMGAAAVDGLRFNSSLENVEARLVAFTKDGEAAREILAEIRAEADATPFAFQAMAEATASLLPSARQAGVGYMELVKLGEILAASNPTQGLSGAAFSLREAVSGDFTSIIERFDLPRQYINQLREEGVPNLEIVRRAMLEMGYDADLVANLAATGTGRLSTLFDTLRGFPQRATAKLYEELVGGLGQFQDLLNENTDTLNAWADQIGDALGRRAASAIDTLAHRLRVFQAAGGGRVGLLAALGIDPDTAAAAIHGLARLERVASSLFEAGRLLLTGDFRGGIFGLQEDDLPITALLALHDAVDGAARTIRDWLSDAAADLQEARRIFGEDGLSGLLSAILPPAWAAFVDDLARDFGRLVDATAGRISEIRAALGEDGWRGLLRQMVDEQTATRIERVTTALDDFARQVSDFIAENPRQVVDFVLDLAKGFFLLRGALAIGELLTKAAGALKLVGAIAGVAATPLAALAVAVGVLAVAWGLNIGDIQGRAEALWRAIEPIFDDLIRQVQDEIPTASAAWEEKWQRDLQPAVEDLFTIVERDGRPVLNDLANNWIRWVIDESREWEQLWAGPLKEAIASIAQMMNTLVIPALDDSVGVMRALNPAFDTMVRHFESWRDILGPVIDLLGRYLTLISEIYQWWFSLPRELIEFLTGAIPRDPRTQPIPYPQGGQPGVNSSPDNSVNSGGSFPTPNPNPINLPEAAFGAQSVTVPVTISGGAPDQATQRALIEQTKREVEDALRLAWDLAARAGGRYPQGTTARV